jgi:hypothetical protein
VLRMRTRLRRFATELFKSILPRYISLLLTGRNGHELPTQMVANSDSERFNTVARFRGRTGCCKHNVEVPRGVMREQRRVQTTDLAWLASGSFAAARLAELLHPMDEPGSGNRFPTANWE